MLRYIAVLGPQRGSGVDQTLAISELLSATPSWHVTFVVPGLSIFVNCRDTPDLTQQLHSDAGVILGTLFPRQSSPYDDAPVNPTKLFGLNAEMVSASQGRHLISAYWGDYVALLLDRPGNLLRVVRAPGGTIPCYYLRYPPLGLIFSHIADISALGISLPPLDDIYIVQQVVSGGLHRMTEPLKGLRSVEQGECLEARLDAPHLAPDRRCYWHPQQFARSSQLIETPDDAAPLLRATLKFCTRSLARQRAGILLRLSGGLDSSIILGCLKGMRAAPALTCYTYYSPGNPADERTWAHLASQNAGCAHVEHAFEESTFDLSRSTTTPLSLEPRSILAFLYREHYERPLAMLHGADAIFCGDGGDSGLGKHSIPFCLIQYLQQQGLGRRIFGIARDIALSTQQTAWEILFKSLRYWLLGSDSKNYRREILTVSRLVNPELTRDFITERSYPHRWFAEDRNIPWATIHQLGMLLSGMESSDDVVLHPTTPDIISPLHAQPVLELLLRIPAHVLFESGRERGLARRAFQNDVPAPILNRQWKDRAPGFQEALVTQHREYLREVLLDGILARKNLLDCRAIETVLSDQVIKNAPAPIEILRHLNTEMWIRNWHAYAGL